MKLVMRVAFVVLLFLWCAPAAVVAQPGATPVRGAGDPYLDGPVVLMTPQGPKSVYLGRLTSEEQQLVLEGELPPVLHVAGGIVGSWVGFGVGHAIQGRWPDLGWIFTAGEAAAVSVVVVGVLDCIDLDGDRGCRSDRGDALLIAGLASFVGLRIWEVIDLWTSPMRRNQRVRNALHKGMARGGARGSRSRVGFFVAPRRAPGDGYSGGIAGITLRF